MMFPLKNRYGNGHTAYNNVTSHEFKLWITKRSAALCFGGGCLRNRDKSGNSLCILRATAMLASNINSSINLKAQDKKYLPHHCYYIFIHNSYHLPVALLVLVHITPIGHPTCVVQ